MDEKTALAKVGKLAAERQNATTLNDLQGVMVKAKALKELLKKVGLQRSMQNAAAKEHIRCQIELGERFDNARKNRERRDRSNRRHDAAPRPLSLKEIGVDSKTVSRFLKVASFKEISESVMEKIDESGQEINTSLFVRTCEGDDDGHIDGDEWFTPQEYIVAAREVLGDIDLDPASCPEAQKIIKAARYYTKAVNGLEQRWYGRIWLNPPFSFPAIEDFTTRAREAFEQNEIESAIVLTNNCADTGWFHRLFEGSCVCIKEGRINFWRPDRDSTGNRQGQAFFYFGSDAAKFSEIFGKFGTIVQRVE
jgi:phage N-6-adenine-methyltransferase